GGRVYAYLNRCAHMPMELDWKPGKFFDVWGLHLICSTHGATYAPHTGRCLRGPCFEEGLITVPVEVRDGRVIIKGDPRVRRELGAGRDRDAGNRRSQGAAPRPPLEHFLQAAGLCLAHAGG